MKKEGKFILIFAGLLILLIVLVLAADPTFEEGAYNVSYYFNEDSVNYHNFTINLTDASQLTHFSILDITWSENGSLTDHSSFYWLPWNDTGFSNSTTGILKINSTLNNETGNFTINVHAQGSVTGHSAKFEFIINATNDAPEFSNLNSTYNLTQNENFFEYLNASDEEEHYPLFFNISFFNNCSLANWSSRGAGNCSLFNLTNIENASASMNFTPTRNDAGIYWANVSLTDNGNGSTCPHNYCDNNTYQQNKTSYQIVKFSIFSSLQVNVSNCSNKIFQEGILDWCTIVIDTKGEEDELNISSYSILRNYASGQSSVSNTSWFYASNLYNSSNFTLTVNVTVNATKTEIGNWTINFTVEDLTYVEDNTTQIYVYVNRTSNDAPDLISIDDVNTSISLEKTINLTVYDDDLLVPDKNDSYGGYNETISFTVQIFNQSNLSQELSLNGFDVEILSMPVAGTNRTEAKIEFTPNETESGDYTINISVTDDENSLDYETFNLSIINNSAPIWNEPLQTDFTIWEDNETYLNLSSNVTDPDGNDLTFSFTNDTAFPSFSLNETIGVINFTSLDEDVGQHLVNITISDGYLTNTTEFNFTVYNVNDTPVIDTSNIDVNEPNATIDANSNVNTSEDNYTRITIWIHDDDFKIPSGQKSFYNESLTINLTIQGPNTDLFNFTEGTDWPSVPNRMEYDALFTPNKTDVGNYNITINVTDVSGYSDVLEFNLTVVSINHAPVLMTLTNQSSAVNRTFYYRINATDVEDGNSNVTGRNTNLSFSYDFLTGTDFINNNQSIFNSTTGELNMTFNDTHDGLYHLNITINDSENLNGSDGFWILVYDIPNITFPASGENFSLQENVLSNLTFQVNHSVGDNLTYLFYIDDMLRYNTSYYGNSTNLTWQFTPNFTDETYGEFENLTLLVYPANSELENRNNMNKSLSWNVNITYANSPVSFSGHIGDKQSNYDQDITIDLTDYFSDVDYSDVHRNQTVDFIISSNSSSSAISASVSSAWVMTLSSSVAGIELINITGNDSSSANTSNNFVVEFTTPTTTLTPTPTPSSGGSSTIPVSLKIIMPDPVSAYQRDRIVVPITLYNNGKKTLSGIDLSSIVVKDNIIRDDIKISFDKSSFSSLAVGQKENVTLTIDVDTTQVGTFEITINASVKNPKYHDWGKLYLTINEGESILDKLLFVEEFIAENPECAELTEIVNEAKEYFKKGDFINTVLKINQAINACKEFVSQSGTPKTRIKIEDKLYNYLFIATIASFFVGIFYYFYRRFSLRRISSNNIKPMKTIYSKVILVISIGIIVLFVANSKMTGFVINNVFSINKSKFILAFIVIGILGLLFFLNKKKISKFLEVAKNRICKKYSKNRMKGLIKKKVYTSLGDYTGRVEEVILGRNKINNLKIRLDNKVKKKNKIKAKGFFVNYKQVEDVGHILIVKDDILKLIKSETLCVGVSEPEIYPKFLYQIKEIFNNAKHNLLLTFARWKKE